jgi:hypothetical protein
MCDGIPGVVFLVITFPSPNWMWKSSTIATICFWIHYIDPSVCFKNEFHTGSKYDVVVRTASLSFPWVQFLFVVVLSLSVAPFSTVVPDVNGVELFFVARTVSGSAPCARFCAELPPSSTPSFRYITSTVPWRSFRCNTKKDFRSNKKLFFVCLFAKI